MERTEKPCRMCGEVKPLEQFNVHITYRDNRENTCKACKAARAKERYKVKRAEYEAMVASQKEALSDDATN